MSPANAAILVVDDDADLRTLISDFLRANGLAVQSAANAEEMDARIAAAKPDLIVLDLMMPGEDGLSILRRLRKPGGPAIIMLSAMGEDTDRIIGLEVGADDYLPKPCNPRELLARIRAVGGGRRAGAARRRWRAPGLAARCADSVLGRSTSSSARCAGSTPRPRRSPTPNSACSPPFSTGRSVCSAATS
jgi:DNA-binding response OmpR family regulator